MSTLIMVNIKEPFRVYNVWVHIFSNAHEMNIVVHIEYDIYNHSLFGVIQCYNLLLPSNDVMFYNIK